MQYRIPETRWRPYLRGLLTGASLAACGSLGIIHLQAGLSPDMNLVLQGLDLDAASRQRVEHGARVFAVTLALVERQHYSKDLDEGTLYSMVNGALNTLDTYSGYLSPEVASLYIYHETAKGALRIGLMVTGNQGGYRIEAVSPDSPAARAGLVPGDRVVRVDGTYVADRPGPEVHDIIRAATESGADLELGIRRPGLGREMTVSVAPEDIRPVGVFDLGLGRDGILHLAVEYFYQGLVDDMAALIDAARARGPVSGIVIDLRNDGGGLTDASVDLFSAFSQEGLVVYEAHGKETGTEIFRTHRDGRYADLGLAVIINGNSASASEMFAGAVKAHGRGKVYGWTSYGKGTVQRVFPVSGGGAIKITSALYRDAASHDVDGIGITPDVPALGEDPGFRPSRFARDPVRDAAMAGLRAEMSGRRDD